MPHVTGGASIAGIDWPARKCAWILLLAAAWNVSLAQVNQADAKLAPSPLARPELTQTRGSLLVNVRNKAGQPLSGISVEVRDLQTHAMLASARSEQDGALRFSDLPIGTFELTVAGGILPPRETVRVGNAVSVLSLTLPLSLAESVGSSHAVSVQQLSVPHGAQEALDKASGAWRRGDLKKAHELASHALAVDPSYGRALALLGFLDLQEGNAAVAAGELKQALTFDPDCPLAYVTLGSALNSMRQYIAALQALSVFPSVSADMWQAHYETARSYMGLRNFELALQELNRAQQLAREDPEVLHLGKAHALLALHRSPEAVIELQTVVRKDPAGAYATEAKTFLTSLEAQTGQ